MLYKDLSHTLKSGMPYYPGTDAPIFETANTVKEHGFKETRLNILSHTGTHTDVPAHIFENGKSIEDTDIGQFTGKAFVADVSGVTDKITVQHLKPNEQKLQSADFVLLYTNWSKYWGKAEYFNNFPVLDRDAAKYLSKLQLKGIGLDVISIDAGDAEYLEIHEIILGCEMIIIENLKIEADLVGKSFEFFAFPLKIKSGDGSPVRAVALLE